jgi:hypothetical protein
LKPDIAVLEGGYSIEGALPYVNVGIVLAMAGIDYSRVREPDYDPDRIRQSPEISRWIEDTSKIILAGWRQRERRWEALQDAKEFDERSRNIYYDTDNISENQKETIRICKDCSGVIKIDSSSNRGVHILAIHIPRKACDHCMELGYEWYDGANPDGYDKIFIQDRVADKFLERKPA